MRSLPAFREETEAEIAQGWIGKATSYPPSIRPGSLELKSNGRFRLVWNASWPAPGTYQSPVRIGEQWRPIAPNACITLQRDITFEWCAIESNNEIIHIMTEGAKVSGVTLLERTFDITKWFRQLGVATLDRWKCLGYEEGGFSVDDRMQMGRRSSAHPAQCTTFLLTSLLQRAATGEQWG